MQAHVWEQMISRPPVMSVVSVIILSSLHPNAVVWGAATCYFSDILAL